MDYGKLQKELQRMGRGMLHDQAAADDLAQEVILSLIERAHDPPRDVRAYAKVCLRNGVKDYQKARRNRKHVSFNGAFHTPPTPAQLARASHHINHDELHAEIDRLRRKDRDLCRRFLAGRSYAELSQEFGVSEGTIGSRLTRIRRKLLGSLSNIVQQKRTNGKTP